MTSVIQNFLASKEFLGKGTYGSVYTGTWRSHIQQQLSNDPITAIAKEVTVVIKIVPYSNINEIEKVGSDLFSLKRLSCPFTVKYFDGFIYNLNVWLLMDFGDSGSLLNIYGEMDIYVTENELKAIFACVSLGLSYLHSQRTVHGNIKAGNLLLSSSGKVMLSDFGISTKLIDNLVRRNTVIGTPYWMAPEILLESSYTEKIDIWSLGITLIEIVDKSPPYYSCSPITAMFLITSKSPPHFNQPEKWSDDMSDFLSKCLVKDPNQRSSSKNIADHKWIKNEVSLLKQQELENRNDCSLRVLVELAKKCLEIKTIKSNNHNNNNNNNNNNHDSVQVKLTEVLSWETSSATSNSITTSAPLTSAYIYSSSTAAAVVVSSSMSMSNWKTYSSSNTDITKTNIINSTLKSNSLRHDCNISNIIHNTTNDNDSGYSSGADTVDLTRHHHKNNKRNKHKYRRKNELKNIMNGAVNNDDNNIDVTSNLSSNSDSDSDDELNEEDVLILSSSYDNETSCSSRSGTHNNSGEEYDNDTTTSQPSSSTIVASSHSNNHSMLMNDDMTKFTRSLDLLMGCEENDDDNILLNTQDKLSNIDNNIDNSVSDDMSNSQLNDNSSCHLAINFPSSASSSQNMNFINSSQTNTNNIIITKSNSNLNTLTLPYVQDNDKELKITYSNSNNIREINYNYTNHETLPLLPNNNNNNNSNNTVEGSKSWICLVILFIVCCKCISVNDDDGHS